MPDPWISVLTTTTRPQYLRGTLAAIDAAGGATFRGQRVIFVDGADDAPIVVDWSTINVSGGGPPRGSRRAAWRILHLAAIARVPFVLYFEDDVRLSRRAIAAMAAIPVPGSLGFLVWCNQKSGLPDTPPAAPAIYERFHWDPANAPGHWGNQALKVPDHALDWFRDPSTEPPADDYAFASDNFLSQRLGSYGVVLPAIVRHVGAETAIPSQAGMGIDGHRGGLNYAGDTFDALELAARPLPVVPSSWRPPSTPEGNGVSV